MFGAKLKVQEVVVDVEKKFCCGQLLTGRQFWQFLIWRKRSSGKATELVPDAA